MLSIEDQKCEDHFVSTHSRTTEGRYMVRLPFKDVEMLKSLNLGESIGRPSRMLCHMETKFKRDAELKSAYTEFMREYIELVHMEFVSAIHSAANLHDIYFLVHHSVWKESSDTTKLRTVFNGSSQLPFSHVSLNDLLYTRPNLGPKGTPR